ncbi:MAG: adenine phosphoribosyltransferase [Candidatus Caenarcaniphilales bacterium]|nr:adenine phosphoribosyltransferase [Candidatus Caenarcaniphilales bacterium]
MTLKTLAHRITETIRDVPDFPKPGIVFKDITPILASPELFREVSEELCNLLKPYDPTCIAGIEARGFIFGAPVAEKLSLPFVPIRKPGKLPWITKQMSYTLEYGEATIEMHEDAIASFEDRVVLIDDLLATGGTCQAALKLIRELGGNPVCSAFLVELGFLEGRKVIESEAPVISLVRL